MCVCVCVCLSVCVWGGGDSTSYSRRTVCGRQIKQSTMSCILPLRAHMWNTTLTSREDGSTLLSNDGKE